MDAHLVKLLGLGQRQHVVAQPAVGLQGGGKRLRCGHLRRLAQAALVMRPGAVDELIELPNALHHRANLAAGIGIHDEDVAGAQLFDAVGQYRQRSAARQQLRGFALELPDQALHRAQLGIAGTNRFHRLLRRCRQGLGVGHQVLAQALLGMGGGGHVAGSLQGAARAGADVGQRGAGVAGALNAAVDVLQHLLQIAVCGHRAVGDAGHHLADLQRGLVGAGGQLAHFLGHYAETPPVFTGAGSLNGGIERQQVGLHGHLLDDVQDGFDVVAVSHDLAKALFQALGRWLQRGNALHGLVQQAIALHGQRMHGIDLVAGDGSRLRHRFHAAVERTNAIEQLCQNASLRARGAHHFGERRHHAGVVHCDIQGLLVQPPQRRCHGTAAHAGPPATGTPRHADQRQQGQTKEGQLTQAIPGP